MLHFLTIGIILGLSAGFAPGPLLALVISESLQHGLKSGVKVALAPVITDLPIILSALCIISGLADFRNGLGLISWAGGLFLLYTGYKSLRTKAVAVPIQNGPSRSLLKGAVANILNPHPYLFWISVGAPTMSKALQVEMLALPAFIGGFYLSLVGSKIMLALAVSKYRSFLAGKVYLYTLRFLGLLLCAFAVILFREGAMLLRLM
jgi:threonine/homoserine/homoserine lactone efflux protein